MQKFDFRRVPINRVWRWEIFAFALVGDIYPSYDNEAKGNTRKNRGLG